MILADILLVLIFALVLSALIGWGMRWRHPAGRETASASFLFLFVVLVIVMWAGAAWLPDWGPLLYGAAWLEILLVGLFVSMIILAVATPQWKPRDVKRTGEIQPETEEEIKTATVFGLFFWLLVLAFLVMVITAIAG